jgi:hypothetical protein
MIRMSEAIQGIGSLDGKTLLGQSMPIGVLHRAPRWANTGVNAARTIRALLARGWILLLQNSLNRQVGFLAAPGGAAKREPGLSGLELELVRSATNNRSSNRLNLLDRRWVRR